VIAGIVIDEQMALDFLWLDPVRDHRGGDAALELQAIIFECNEPGMAGLKTVLVNDVGIEACSLSPCLHTGVKGRPTECE
jgi:hypothetical protein